jgi:hypothetical protein
MMAEPQSTSEALTPSATARPWARRIGLIIGGLLLIAALVMAWRQQEIVKDAVASLADLPPGRLTLYLSVLGGSVVVNLFLSGVVFRLLISRYGAVGFWEMQALIASSALFNYLPMRAGMLGRVAYHRAYNGISVGDSVKTIVQAVIMSVCSAAYVALVVVLSFNALGALWLLLLLPPAMMGSAALLVSKFRVWWAAARLRYLEVLVNALRYWAAFSLLGLPIGPQSALAFAAISALATMIPFLSNGLGVREWAVGLLAQALTPYALALGITADLLNRAAELLIIATLGSLGLAMLARQRRA